VLTRFLDLVENEAAKGAELKAAQENLTEVVAAKYPKLTEDEIKSLVVDDKWLATLEADVQGELDRVSQTLTGRIRELAERYARPLPALAAEVDALAAKVDEHLKKMGAAWK
jgi:type I restriction enzyme M protein